jgi:hypothetical protein
MPSTIFVLAMMAVFSHQNVLYVQSEQKRTRFISITEFNPTYSNELELDSLVAKIANNSITLSSADR